MLLPNSNTCRFGFILLLILHSLAALAPLPVDCLSVMTRDWLVFYSMFELWKLLDTCTMDRGMQSSDGENGNECDIESNRFFLWRIAHHYYIYIFLSGSCGSRPTNVSSDCSLEQTHAIIMKCLYIMLLLM